VKTSSVASRTKEDSLLDSKSLFSQTLLIQHVIGLVENEHLDVPRIELLLDDHVHESSRSSDDDVSGDGSGMSVEGVLDTEEDLNGNELSHRSNDLLDLTSQLSRRSETDSLREEGYDIQKNGEGSED